MANDLWSLGDLDAGWTNTELGQALLSLDELRERWAEESPARRSDREIYDVHTGETHVVHEFVGAGDSGPLEAHI